MRKQLEPEKIAIRFDGRQSLDPLPLECIADCSRPGPMDEPVAYWCGRLDIQAEPDLIREHLSGFGAWDDEQLADDAENLERLVWTWACSAAEERRELGLSLEEEEAEEAEAETWADMIYLQA